MPHRHLEIRLPVSGVLAVILSAAKDLCVRRARPFAALRVTGLLSKYLDATLIPCSYDNDKNYILELYQKIGYNELRE